MENKIKSGDVVVLKSGGPKMTVKFENSVVKWACKWFENGEMKE